MKRALLVIDMVKDFVEEEGALSVGPVGKKIIPTIKKRLEEYRSNNEPVIFIGDSHLPDDSEFDMFPPHCLSGEAGAEIVEELQPQKGERIIPKRRFSAFFGTDLDLTLREKGVERIELTGTCTNICILYTAAEARMLNYEVEVRSDTVASFDEEAHRFALKEMENTLGVKVIS